MAYLLSCSANAQADRWLLGTGITYDNYMHHPGINLNVTYRPIGNLHVGPDFSALLSREEQDNGIAVKRKELEYNFNATYLFSIKREIFCYPLMGINRSKVTIHPENEMADKLWVTAYNLGGGVEWNMDGLRFFFESKYVSKLQKYDATLGIVLEL